MITQIDAPPGDLHHILKKPRAPKQRVLSPALLSLDRRHVRAAVTAGEEAALQARVSDTSARSSAPAFGPGYPEEIAQRLHSPLRWPGRSIAYTLPWYLMPSKARVSAGYARAVQPARPQEGLPMIPESESIGTMAAATPCSMLCRPPTTPSIAYR